MKKNEPKLLKPTRQLYLRADFGTNLQPAAAHHFRFDKTQSSKIGVETGVPRYKYSTTTMTLHVSAVEHSTRSTTARFQNPVLMVAR